MQPDELPAAIPAEPVTDTRFTDALMALSSAHSDVQQILSVVLASPRTKAEQQAVKFLGAVRNRLWTALTDLGTGHPLYGTTMGRDT